MTTLFVLGLVFFGTLAALIAVPLILLKLVLGLTVAAIAIPLQIVGSLVGGLVRAVVKGGILLALLAIPLGIVFLPFALFVAGCWVVYRVLRPKRMTEAYVVS